MKLTSEFFARVGTQVAKDLIGTYLVRAYPDGKTSRRQITETEGYLGEKDSASHARVGKTERTKVMYKKPGTLYVYLIYGIHDMLNIVTKEAGEPEAVLIRGINGLDGPGILTRELDITKAKQNGKPLGEDSGLWIEARADGFDADRIVAKPRVGIDYADEYWRNQPLNFSYQA